MSDLHLRSLPDYEYCLSPTPLNMYSFLPLLLRFIVQELHFWVPHHHQFLWSIYGIFWGGGYNRGCFGVLDIF
jgi:hypothetical protein